MSITLKLLTLDLVELLSNLSLNKKLENASVMMNYYYGLSGSEGISLEKIGSLSFFKLTRERVRQVINNGVAFCKELEEKNPQCTPFKETKDIFDGILKNKRFVSLKDVLLIPYFSGFSNNSRGLIAFLNDVGIRQVLYRNQYYFFISNGNVNKEKIDIIALIQKENKVIRKEATKKRMSEMSKTVTWIDKAGKERLNSLSRKNKIGFNVMYERILFAFLTNKPYVAEDFSKFEKEIGVYSVELAVQVGLYIPKKISEEARAESDKVSSSFMGYIRAALLWFNQLPAKEQKKYLK